MLAVCHIATWQDLYVGCKITVFKRMFELLDADEYTYTYMENNKHIFIMADVEATLASLRGQVGLGHRCLCSFMQARQCVPATMWVLERASTCFTSYLCRSFTKCGELQSDRGVWEGG